MYGLTEQEALSWRVSNERFNAIINDEQTIIHTIRESANNFGEFLFVTTSRVEEEGRVAMSFYSLGFHEHRERWLTDEWFWYQANAYPEMMQDQIDREEAKEMIQHRLESIRPYIQEDTQTEYGQLFETIADLTDDDGALVELQDLGNLAGWLLGDTDGDPGPEPEFEPSPTGENLLDKASREKLPPLYSGEKDGLEALAQVKFFMPAGSWTWYASEFDQDDIFFGLVVGFEVELGYYSLRELQEVRGPMGLLIERDLYFEPKSLRELMEWHRRNRRE